MKTIMTPEEVKKLISASISFVMKNLGECLICKKIFVAWEMNWDGGYEFNACFDCAEEKKIHEEAIYETELAEAKTAGKEIITATGKLAGWDYKQNFYGNPEFEPESRPDIDDIIRAEKKNGKKELFWIPPDFEALQEFAFSMGWNFWTENEFVFMSVTHKLKR